MIPDIHSACVTVRESERIIFIVAVISIVTCAIVFFVAMGYLIYVNVNTVDSSKDPVAAVNFLVSLVVVSMATYQCVLSTLVLGQWIMGKHRYKSYIVSLWYMSHLGILTVYWILFIVEFSACVAARKYFIAVFATVIAISYQSVFTYFVIITYRYLKTVNNF